MFITITRQNTTINYRLTVLKVLHLSIKYIFEKLIVRMLCFRNVANVDCSQYLLLINIVSYIAFQHLRSFPVWSPTYALLRLFLSWERSDPHSIIIINLHENIKVLPYIKILKYESLRSETKKQAKGKKQ